MPSFSPILRNAAMGGPARVRRWKPSATQAADPRSTTLGDPDSFRSCAPFSAWFAPDIMFTRATYALRGPLGRAGLSRGRDYNTLLTETRGSVGLITLNRPKALNALNSEVMHEVVAATRAFDADDAVGAMVLTGSEKAFAAGADIKQMQPFEYAQLVRDDSLGGWEQLRETKKPLIAAVNGFALGGGCELAMMCDLILAGENAKFGQPEIKLGVIPGMGGTQRLVRAIGKAKAMEMVLTGRMMDAAQAERDGLVARVLPSAELVDGAVALGEEMAKYSRPTVSLAKFCVNAAFEHGLADGLDYEKRLFHSCFALADQKEGMAAFIEKREPNFEHK